MQKLLLVSIIFSLLISQTAFATVQYLDVDSTHKYEKDISFLSNLNIVQGYSDSEFKPNRKLNRAEFLKILVEGLVQFSAANPVDDYGDQGCFTDVPPHEWYTKYVCYAKTQGIVKGNPDGTFKPESKVNLAEALKITLKTVGASFEEGTPWYKEFTEIAEDGHIIPLAFANLDQNVTRGQMANLLNRTMKSKFMDTPYDLTSGNPFTTEYVTYNKLVDKAVDCYNDEYFIIQVDSEPTQMCIPKTFGNAVMYDKSNFKEQLYFFNFEDEFGNQNKETPEIWYERSDFVLTGGGDIAQTNWSLFDFDKSENELKLIFSKSKGLGLEDIEVEKTTVDGKKALRVQYHYFSDFTGKLDGVEYYIPNGLKSDTHTYNITIRSADSGIMTDVFYATKPNTITTTDEFVGKIKF